MSAFQANARSTMCSRLPKAISELRHCAYLILGLCRCCWARLSCYEDPLSTNIWTYMQHTRQRRQNASWGSSSLAFILFWPITAPVRLIVIAHQSL